MIKLSFMFYLLIKNIALYRKLEKGQINSFGISFIFAVFTLNAVSLFKIIFVMLYCRFSLNFFRRSFFFVPIFICLIVSLYICPRVYLLTCQSLCPFVLVDFMFIDEIPLVCFAGLP